MTDVYLGVGSNIQRNKHILNGILALNKQFSPIQCSPVYESVAVGFEGDNFYNLVVHFSTNQPIASLGNVLSTIEDDNGRDRNGPKFGPRSLDLDLLLCDDLILASDALTLPRPEIYSNAFVLQPLADIAGNLMDPVKKQTYQQLWDAYDKNKQKLWQIEFPLKGL